MIVLDTTILFYAVTVGHEFSEASRALISGIESGRLHATTTTEVIQEFAHAYSRRRARGETVRLSRHYAELLAPLLSADREQLDEGLRLFERHAELGAFDAVLAAVARSTGAEALVSADADFRVVPSLRHIEPATPAFDRLLAAERP